MMNMKKITYFYLASCPHCIRANKLIDEIIAEDPKYAAVVFDRIEESQQMSVAKTYDYWYVPCFFIGKEKLMEGVPSKEKIKAAMDAALSE